MNRQNFTFINIDEFITCKRTFTYPIDQCLTIGILSDKDGQTYGPQSVEVLQEVVNVDKMLDYLLDQLKEKKVSKLVFS